MNAPPIVGSAGSVASSFVRHHAPALKLLFIGVLVLLLLVLLNLVSATLQERRARHDGAVATIAGTWGKSQRLLGPVLAVPYVYRTEKVEWVKGADGKLVSSSVSVPHEALAYFLPEALEIEGEIAPSRRHLGIYSTHVYSAGLKLRGRFTEPGFEFTGVRAPEPQWERAYVCFAFSDLRGTREALVLDWGGREVPLQPGARLNGVGAGLHAPVPLAANAGPRAFALDLTLNGSGGLTVVPLGRQTVVKLSSTWQAPGFHGAFLPVEREIGAAGFGATWKVSYYGRDFPQQWTADAASSQSLEAAAFGVNLIEPVTAYRTIERAIKYGVLFLALVFVTFFLFETIGRVQLTALNYLLVGAALCLFYLGLLSLSEFTGFTAAYAAAASASLLLIGLYSWSVLRSGGRAIAVSGMLGGVYGYLYFVLQMEDFALLAGTAALFAVLSAVMFATRKVNDSVEPPPIGAPGEAAS